MRRPIDFYLGLWTLLFVAATAALVIAEPFATPTKEKPEPLALKAVEQAGRLRVDWDSGHPDIEAAQSATLDVRDGTASHRYPVEKAVLQSGGLDYLRKSGDVFLTLTLLNGNQQQTQATVRTIAAVVGPVLNAETQPQNRRNSRRGVRARRR